MKPKSSSQEYVFAVPYGVSDEGQLVYRTEAVRGAKYFCPSCRDPLILRKGRIRTPHFAHSSNTQCTPETVLHKTVKSLIVKTVMDWKAGKSRAPLIRRFCSTAGCDKHHDQELPKKVEAAVEEYHLSSGRVVDVALVSNSQVVAAVEVFVTHAVDGTKEAKLELPWLEVEAQQILEQPLLWICHKDSLLPFQCPKCRQREVEEQRQKEHLRKLALTLKITLPPSPPYSYATSRCYRCKREIIVYTWDNHEFCARQRPPLPVPPTVHFRYSKMMKVKYWTNCCRFCGASQEDKFLYYKRGEPFYWGRLSDE